jgi:hypothetical protein
VCTERARPCREEFFLSYFSLFYCLSTSSDRRENGVGCFDASSYFYFYFFFKNLLPARPAISQKSLINIDPNVWEKQTDRRQRNAQDFLIIIGRCHAEVIIIFIRLIWIYYFPLVFPSTSTCRIYIAGQYVHTHVTNKSIFASNVTDKIFKNVRRRPGHSDTLLYIYRGDYRLCIPMGCLGSLIYPNVHFHLCGM